MTSIKKSPFDFVKSINNKEYIEDIKGFSPYIVTNALSANKLNVLAINAINNIGAGKLSDRAIYDYYYHLVRQTDKYYPYPKSVKDSKNLEYIMKYFQLNEQTAKSYLELLETEEIEEIRSFYEDHGVK